MNKIKRALISVHDKEGVLEFSKSISRLGVEILSTGGTAKLLKEGGVGVIDVSEYTGSPEIFDGRLKTLHPKIHGGILAIRENDSHINEMKANDIGPIDLVVVNLYPFEKTVAKPGCSFEDAIENIDIGGPTMIRAAAKNHEDVAVVVEPADYFSIVSELEASGGSLSKETKFRLAKKAFVKTASYDSAIINYLTAYSDSKEPLSMPSAMGIACELVSNLRYGENPHQNAAFYRRISKTSDASIVDAKVLQGKELSYNNIMDADAVLQMVLEHSDASFAAVVVKHSNPCGAAVSGVSLEDALAKAIACDPVSAFGGIIGVTGTVNLQTAKLISESFFEVVVAPAFDDDARKVLSGKKNLRLLEVANLGREKLANLGWHIRDVRNGILIQQPDALCEDIRVAKVVTKRAPTEKELEALNFAWRVCKHVKSNAIVFATDDRTLGIGAGQMSRIDSANLAIMKCASSLKGSVVASDAFFPFRDGVDVAAKAGATASVSPGGSLRDLEVIAAADEHGMAMVFTGHRHFRH